MLEVPSPPPPLAGAWDKPALLELLLPHLSAADLTATTPDRSTALHLVADMGGAGWTRCLPTVR